MVLFLRILRVRPRENFHFSLCLFIVMKTSENREIKPLRISAPSPKSWKYLYVKIMAYTVLYNMMLLLVSRDKTLTICRLVPFIHCLRVCSLGTLLLLLLLLLLGWLSRILLGLVRGWSILTRLFRCSRGRGGRGYRVQELPGQIGSYIYKPVQKNYAE